MKQRKFVAWHSVFQECTFVLQATQQENTDDHDAILSTSPGIQFEPVMQLPPVETKTLEEDEEEFFKM